MLTLARGGSCNCSALCYNVIVEVKDTTNVMHLNHPKPSPCPRSMEKLSSTKLVPGAKKVGTAVPGETRGPSTSWRSVHLEALPGDNGGGPGLALGPRQPLCPGWTSRPPSSGLVTRSPTSGSAQGRWRLHRLEASAASHPPFKVRGSSGRASMGYC